MSGQFDASIVLKHKEGILDIWTDEGRIMTPFVDVKQASLGYDSGKIGAACLVFNK